MKTRTHILGVIAILMLVAPAANAGIPSDAHERMLGASAATVGIPSDAHDRAASTAALQRTVQSSASSSPKLHRGKHVKNTAIKVGTYNPNAYVPGGSSPKVAAAITDAGRR